MTLPCFSRYSSLDCPLFLTSGYSIPPPQLLLLLTIPLNNYFIKSPECVTFECTTSRRLYSRAILALYCNQIVQIALNLIQCKVYSFRGNTKVENYMCPRLDELSILKNNNFTEIWRMSRTHPSWEFGGENQIREVQSSGRVPYSWNM